MDNPSNVAAAADVTHTTLKKDKPQARDFSPQLSATHMPKDMRLAAGVA